MALIQREAVAVTELPEEVVTVEEMGGDVIVRGLFLGERFQMIAEQERLRAPRGDESEEQAHVRAGGEIIPMVLAHAVLAADRQPLFTAERWANHLVAHSATGLRLFKRVMGLSGNGAGDLAKN